MSQRVLQRPTLVLNRNWQPIHVATVARAVIMLYSGTVRVVDPQDYQTYDWDDWSRLRPTRRGPLHSLGDAIGSRVPKSSCWPTTTECRARRSPSVAATSTSVTAIRANTAASSRRSKT